MNDLVQYGFGLLITVIILILVAILRLEYEEKSAEITTLVVGMTLIAWVFILAGMEDGEKKE